MPAEQVAITPLQPGDFVGEGVYNVLGIWEVGDAFVFRDPDHPRLFCR